MKKLFALLAFVSFTLRIYVSFYSYKMSLYPCKLLSFQELHFNVLIFHSICSTFKAHLRCYWNHVKQLSGEEIFALAGDGFNLKAVDGSIVAKLSWPSLVVIILGEHVAAFQWRHNRRDGVSNHRRREYLLNHLFRRRSKKTWKLRVTGLCEVNSPYNCSVTRKKFLFDVVIMRAFQC